MKESVMCYSDVLQLWTFSEKGRKDKRVYFSSLQSKKALLCFSCFSFFSPIFGSCIASGKALGIISYFVPVSVFLSACGECFLHSFTEFLAALLQGPQGCQVVMYFLQVANIICTDSSIREQRRGFCLTPVSLMQCYLVCECMSFFFFLTTKWADNSP